MRTSIALLAVAAAALAAAACGQDDLINPSVPDATGEMPVEVSASREAVSVDRADVVATVDLEHGGVATFLDLGDGHIGIAERAPAQARFVSLAMIQNLNATPLEVYLALRPRNTGVPDRLLRDHQRAAQLRGVSGIPRALTAPAAAATPLADPGYDSYPCDSSGDQWVEDWKDAFAGITKYRSAIYKQSQVGSLLFYPGAAVYHGTNTNSVTYLGACNGDDRRNLTMTVQRRTSGKWWEIDYAVIEAYEKYTFYSGIPAAYRGYIHAHPSIPQEHFGIGAAWTLSLSEKANP